MKPIFKMLLFFPLMHISLASFAQNALFLKRGNIQYEKRVNTHALLDEQASSEEDNIWAQQFADAYKKANPQFKLTQFNLAFNNNFTLYTPIADEKAHSNNLSDFVTSVAGDNTVYSDLKKQQAVSLKNVFDDKFLITDSTRQIQWKITDEMRDIAGFRCRRANAIIMDSIYVVAFYTSEILTTGGPESFNGLPGMIMLVALPHQHMSWIATKILTGENVTDASLVPPTKGKPTNNKELFLKLQGRLKDWGANGTQIIQNAML